MILMPSHPEEVWALVRVAGSDQDGAMYLTAGFTGLRMGELRALQWRDVNYTNPPPRIVWRFRNRRIARHVLGRQRTPRA